MIIWGGIDQFQAELNTGGRYNPAIDNWQDTSTTDAPEGRNAHSLVWTGSEVIVWGGLGETDFLNNGGRYNPVIDSWTITSTTNAPVPRYNHTALWTGNDMIIWGGYAALLATRRSRTPGADTIQIRTVG
jgi:N-acetylneuraminic acid mutarotase